MGGGKDRGKQWRMKETEITLACEGEQKSVLLTKSFTFHIVNRRSNVNFSMNSVTFLRIVLLGRIGAACLAVESLLMTEVKNADTHERQDIKQGSCFPSVATETMLRADNQGECSGQSYALKEFSCIEQ